MTVIACVINKYCTAHASDSLLTELKEDGTLEPTEWEKSKIIPVPKWRGAFTFWGLASYKNWSTQNWLQKKAREAGNHNSAESFAQAVTDELNNEFSKMSFKKPTDAGIGIHFSAYEYIDNYWIPELFLISNWGDTSYTSLRYEGIGLTRETFHAICGEQPKPEHRNQEYRLMVHSRIQSGVMLRYNNGDPLMFNVSANAFLSMFGELEKRGILNHPGSWETYVAIARRPIEIVSNVQHDFCQPGTRVVGGRLHDLAITPGGECFSTTGDC